MTSPQEAPRAARAPREHYDAVVVGGGIAGLQAALDLADQGFEVLVVERRPSIGGRMIGLSKVFPTLDCASCITTPKMAAAAHHPRIHLQTLSEVLSATRQSDGHWRVRVLAHPRYVNEERCIGCRLCEYACDVEVPDDFEGGLGAHRAIYVPFTNAIPQVALMEPEHCILCGKCIDACPTGAVELDQLPQEFEVTAGTVIVATGFDLNDIGAKKQYHGDEIANVISPLTMERLLAPHGPYGRVLRPADGKQPDSIAFVLCAGSRDRSLGVPYCSRICCMYSIKQAMLLSGALPFADITIYYMDIRAFGKGYEPFYQNARAMGIEFVKAKVARIEEVEGRNVKLRYERVDGFGQVEERVHDLVVLALGVVPAAKLTDRLPLKLGEDGFVALSRPLLEPGATGEPGLFVAGTASGPKDIVDTIAEAGAAAMAASNHLHALRGAAREEPAHD